MADTQDDGFEEAFKGFGDDPAPVTPPTEPVTPPANPGAAAQPPKEEPKPADEPKKPETPEKPEDKKTPPAEQPPATDDKKKEEEPKPPEAPETPEAPQPLTKDDVKSVVSDLLNTERTSSKELDITTQEVLEKYYPDGLSNVLTDEATGKKLETPQDVVDVTDGKMTLDQAAQWLMNEQYKLDNDVAKIKSQAKEIATTTLNFKHDGIAVVQKYQPLFEGLKEKYPQLQDKVFQALMKQVKVDKERGVILSSPDVIEFYDLYLTPYQEQFEQNTNQPATNPTPPPGGEPPKPTAEDRMDEGGDGGTSPVDDPNDFAQQVTKELAKPL